MTDFEHLLSLPVPVETELMRAKWAADRLNADNQKEENDRLWRYACPHCGGTNAFTGDPKTGLQFRGSAVCTDCGKGFAAVKYRPIGKDGPLLKLKRAFEEYEPSLLLVKRADDDKYPFTVAVDLDGTLAKKEEPFNPATIGEPIPGAIAWVTKFHEAGARIIIFTVRGDADLVATWLTKHKVPYDHINENPDQPKDSSGKILADVYYDDRAINATNHDKAGPEVLGRIKAHDLLSAVTLESDDSSVKK